MGCTKLELSAKLERLGLKPDIDDPTWVKAFDRTGVNSEVRTLSAALASTR